MRRIPQLDLLRGAAVLFVIAEHYPCCDFFRRVGWAGVDLFFVLSGFLISGLLFTEWKASSSISVGRFLIRRGLKIYPGFYVFLALTSLPLIRLHGSSPLWNELLFLQDYMPHYWGHTWSLAVEEHFYLLLPLLLLTLTRFGKLDWIPAISGVLLVTCLAMRIHAATTATVNDQVLYPTHLRVDALFAGVALGYVFHFKPAVFSRWSRWWLLPLAATLLVPLTLLNGLGMLAVVISCNTLAFVLLVWWAITRPSIRFLPVERVGFYSYSIYVWHMMITAIFRSHRPTLLTFSLNLITCVVWGICMAEVVEIPALKLRDKVFPASRPSRQLGTCTGFPLLET